MSLLIIALDGQKVVTEPTSDQFAGWAYEAHCRSCATCRRGDTWCSTGSHLLAATAPHGNPDLPGYPGI